MTRLLLSEQINIRKFKKIMQKNTFKITKHEILAIFDLAYYTVQLFRNELEFIAYQIYFMHV